MNRNGKILMLLSVLSGLAFSAAQADDKSITTPNNDVYTTAPSADSTPAPASVSHKKHHPRKKHVSAPAQTMPTPGSTADPHAAPPPNGKIIPSVTDTSVPGNDAGKPNMNTGDHTPGTTGTSGQ